MSWLAVEKALVQQITSLGYPVIQENDVEDKSKQTPIFLEVYNIPAETETLDKCISERYNGIYQISVHGQLGEGKATLLGAVDNVLNAYAVNELPELDSCVVSIDSRSTNQAVRDGKFYRQDISIDYFALMSK